ncbi:IS3 family transposase [Micromonospora luteifusca]|uniref:IS3 family transposase n=1 Tax=Micromonospora luteifusca TaxID=709860 RepID=UPI0035581126
MPADLAATQPAGDVLRCRHRALLVEEPADPGSCCRPDTARTACLPGGDRRQAHHRKSPRRWRTTTIPDPNASRRPDLVGRDFTTNPAALDSRWCGDITYINTWQGWLYLATVIDLASRRIVGWTIADHLKTDLIDAALTDALARRRPTSGLVFHSDRGCQYTSAQHARLAQRHGIRLSVGRRGQCWDNAVAESFFSTIKTELLHRQPWPTHQAARQAIFEYIEGWYNTRRRHSTLGYLSPAAFEATGSHLQPTVQAA